MEPAKAGEYTKAGKDDASKETLKPDTKAPEDLHEVAASSNPNIPHESQPFALYATVCIERMQSVAPPSAPSVAAFTNPSSGFPSPNQDAQVISQVNESNTINNLSPDLIPDPLKGSEPSPPQQAGPSSSVNERNTIDDFPPDSMPDSIKESKTSPLQQAGPSSSGIGENVGVLVQNVGKNITSSRIEQLELRIKQLELQLTAGLSVGQPEKNDLDPENALNSTDKELDLTDERCCMSILEVDLCSTPTDPEKCKELNDSLAEADVLKTSEVEFENSSLQSNVVPVVNDATELEKLPVLKDCAVLLKNASTEIDAKRTTCTWGSSSKRPIQCDIVLNLCSKCNSNINDNLNSGFLQELEKKNEKINRLNIRYESLVELSKEYTAKLEQNKKTITNLKKKLFKAQKAYKECNFKYQACRAKLSSREKELEQLEESFENSQFEQKHEIETYKEKLSKSQQEKLSAEAKLAQMSRSSKKMGKKFSNMEERIRLLETKFPKLEENLKKKEQKLPAESGICLEELNKNSNSAEELKPTETDQTGKCLNPDTEDLNFGPSAKKQKLEDGSEAQKLTEAQSGTEAQKLTEAQSGTEAQSPKKPSKRNRPSSLESLLNFQRRHIKGPPKQSYF